MTKQGSDFGLTDSQVSDLAFSLREALGDSLRETTPETDLTGAVLTILQEAGQLAAQGKPSQ